MTRLNPLKVRLSVHEIHLWLDDLNCRIIESIVNAPAAYSLTY